MASRQMPSWDRPATASTTEARGWEETNLYERWYQHVAEPPSNDFVIAVTASGRSSVSRTGKTTLGLRLCKEFDLSEDGFSAEEKATMSEAELGSEIVPNVESQSAVMYDEAQGTPDGTGLNKRRGMKSSTINAINAILANGDQQLTLVIIGQQLSMIDTLLYPIIDAWVLITDGPTSPGPPIAVHHKMHVEDYDLSSPDIKTPGQEDLTWAALPADDADYQEIERIKQANKQGTEDDESEDTGKSAVEQRNERIRALNKNGLNQKDLAEAWDLTQQRVSQILNEDD